MLFHNGIWHYLGEDFSFFMMLYNLLGIHTLYFIEELSCETCNINALLVMATESFITQTLF